MNNFYADSLIAELKNLTNKENSCPSKLQSICDSLKKKVVEMVDNGDLLSCLRYSMHLQSELICKKTGSYKKK